MDVYLDCYYGRHDRSRLDFHSHQYYPYHSYHSRHYYHSQCDFHSYHNSHHYYSCQYYPYHDFHSCHDYDSHHDRDYNPDFQPNEIIIHNFKKSCNFFRTEHIDCGTSDYSVHTTPHESLPVLLLRQRMFQLKE